MLYSGESFSTSLPGLCSVLPSRPLLNAAVMPMLLSKELSPSSDGYGFSFSWSLVLWGGNIWHTTKDPVCPASDRWWYLFFVWRIICYHSPLLLYGREISFSLHNISCPGVTMKDSDYQNGNPMCEEQHNQFLYLCNTNNPNQRNLKSLLFSDFLWFSFTLFAFKCDIISNGFDC